MIRTSLRTFWLVVGTLLCLLATPAYLLPAIAQDAPAAGRAERAALALKEDIRVLRDAVGVPDIGSTDLAANRREIEALRKRTRSELNQLKKPLTEVRQQVAKLGEPAKDGIDEDVRIADQRKTLQAAVSRLEAVEKQLSLLALEADQLSSFAAQRQRENFIARVFEPTRSILNPYLWLDGGKASPLFFTRLGALLRSGLQPVSPDNAKASKAALAAILVLMTLSGAGIVLLWTRWRRPAAPRGPIDDLHRVWRSIRIAVLSAMIMVVATLLTFLSISLLGQPDPRIQRFIIAFAAGAAFAAIASALSRGVYRPSLPSLRLANFDAAGALRLHFLSAAAISVYALDLFVSDLASIMFLPISFTIAWSALVAVVLAVLIAGLLAYGRSSEAFEDPGEDRRFYFGFVRYLVPVIWLVLLLAAISLVTGYVALAKFAVSQVVLTGVLVSGLYLIHHLADALVTSSLQSYSYAGRFLRSSVGLSELAVSRIGLMFSVLVDLGIVLLGVPLILFQWTLTWIDFRSWISTAFFGFKVGDVDVQPSNIVLALAVILAGLIIVRLFMSWLESRVISRTSMDSGVRNSVLTGARYTGFVLVIGLGLTSAGLDFSNLAIVLGALGVGIGFGLQSIVNNFVSGLILLAERPIKVGDWIECSAGEGTVKNINVRSTEIETFDMCSIIVPNSSLISEPVSNWTHGAQMGRVRVKVGVSYDADPERVRDILLECANAQEMVMSKPGPTVMFKEFGASSLDFELRIYIADIGWCVWVASELRYAIFRAMNAEGIEIPYPQQDIHLKSVAVDTVEALRPAPAKAKRK